MLEDKPTNLPDRQPGGESLKSFTQAVLDRRATTHFTNEAIPDEILDAILRLGGQAPSGYNFQPWRFIVVRDEENRKRLQKAAYNQPKVAEAPIIIIAVGMKEAWKETAGEVLREGAARGAGRPDGVDQYKQSALDFLSHMPMNVWVNRHVTYAVVTMMLAAESYGYDTAPMEGFDSAAVKREFGIPDEGEVVSLLAIGRATQPDKPFPGRFPLKHIVFSERFGEAWQTK